MPFNPVANFNQGLLSGQNIQKSQRENQIRGLQNVLSGQMGQGGFDPSASVEMQQLTALAPEQGARSLAVFQNLDKSRQKAFFQDAREGRKLLEAKDGEGFLDLLSDRLENVEKLGGDPSDVQSVLQSFNSGDIEGTLNQLKMVEQTGIEEGFLRDLTPKAKGGYKSVSGGMVFDPSTGTYSVDPVATAHLASLEEKKNTKGGLGISDRKSINKDITGFIKQAMAIKSAASDLAGLKKLGTGAASIAAVFKFMKANDPGSTVREGEFATAESSSGVPEAVRNFYNKLITGERVDEGTIQSFIDVSQSLSNSAINASTTMVDGYLNTFEDTLPKSFAGKVRERIPSLFDIKEVAPIVGAQTLQQGDNNHALQWAQANPNDPRAAQIMQKIQGAQ